MKLAIIKDDGEAEIVFDNLEEFNLHKPSHREEIADAIKQRVGLINHLKNRRERGLANPKQLATLMAMGVPPSEAKDMSFNEASARLAQLIDKKKSDRQAKPLHYTSVDDSIETRGTYDR
jgi:hypothetical protein